MASLEELRSVRLEKLQKIKDAGMIGYPADTARTHTIKEVRESFDALEKSGDTVVIAGRVMAQRGQGGLLFINIFDGSETLQGMLKQDEMEERLYTLFEETVDIGDFVELSGTLLVTKRGEQSIQVKEWKMLTKSLRPLPDQHSGFKDIEERLRKRYLDILSNPELREVVEKKALFWRAIRRFLEDRGFIEVETPTLEVTTGGAEAAPFRTHHNDFDLDVFLRISVGELWQKRLMASGIERVFEIGRAYRNEGSSPEHVQEFTNMEFYAAYLNFEDGKKLLQELYRTIAEEVFGTTKFSTRGHTFDLADEWEELDYVTTVEKVTGINVLTSTEEEMEAKLKELGVVFEGKNRERMADSLWKHCRKQVSGPAFLLNHPKLVAPLSKEHEDNPELTKTLQVILAGSEVGRAHGELNDPEEQQKRFDIQQELIDAGDDEAMMADQEFVEALEHGIPPTFGFGVGERLFSFFVDKPIREAQIFPLVKPKED